MSEKMKILVAYDGSDCADAALDDLQRAGLPDAVEALVISVAEVWLPPPPPSSLELLEEAEDSGEIPVTAEVQKVYEKHTKAVEAVKALAERARSRLQKNFPGWQVSAEGVPGSPAWEIIGRADALKPDLIVVGSQGRSALGRFVLGSVSQKILSEARSSVRVARGRVEVDSSPVRLVVAVDGSPGSTAAIHAVAARPWPKGSEARVIVVEDPLVPTALGRLIPPVARWIEESDKEDAQWVQRTADEAVSELSGTGLSVSSQVEVGEPKHVLVEQAEKFGADCIFLGSTGFSSSFSRFLLGSVSAAVAARAHCSVEVVRATQTDGA
jgi:nucleotide-binding universal stress UspA family protein